MQEKEGRVRRGNGRDEPGGESFQEAEQHLLPLQEVHLAARGRLTKDDNRVNPIKTKSLI
jgi:hypothetical protein